VPNKLLQSPPICRQPEIDGKLVPNKLIVLPIAWTQVETDKWDPVTGRTPVCTPNERETASSKMADPIDGHCLKSIVGDNGTSQGAQTPDRTLFHWYSGDGINESVS
jgi:hypothetical protein